MTIANFKARVAAYMNRDATVFTSGGVDNILEAMNDCRRFAQQSYRFSTLGTQAFIQTSAAGATWTTCKATPSAGGTDVPMRTIDRGWMYDVSGSIYSRTVPISFDLDQRFDRLLANNVDILNAAASIGTPRPSVQQFLYIEGTTLYYNGVSTPTWIMVTGTKMLADLTSSDTTDFFTDHASNWLLLAVCQNLNGFLKDDQRVAISDAAVQRHWNALTEWDAQAGAMGSWTNLD